MSYTTKAGSIALDSVQAASTQTGSTQLSAIQPDSIQPDSIPQAMLEAFFAKIRYLYIGDRTLDFATLLARDCWDVVEDNGVITGFLSLHIEERPATLPSTAPSRIYVRAICIAQGCSPTTHLIALFDRCLKKYAVQINALPNAFQIICYGSDSWLVKALSSAGFEVVERIQYYQLDRLSTRLETPCVPATSIDLRLVEAADFTPLAQLDAETFPPLWHFGEADLRSLWPQSQIWTAYLDGTLIGYSIISDINDNELGPELDNKIGSEIEFPQQAGDGVAQLVRLAVHPSAQGLGLGRQLLCASIQDAHRQGIERLTLNTQTTNERSKRLYRALGFRPQGRTIPVLVKQA